MDERVEELAREEVPEEEEAGNNRVEEREVRLEGESGWEVVYKEEE